MQSNKLNIENLSTEKNTQSKKRVLIKQKSGKNYSDSIDGIIVAILGKSYFVKSANNELIDSSVSGAVVSPHKHKNVAVVGDNVLLLIDSKHKSETGLSTGLIVEIKERKSYLARRAAGKANREHILASNADFLGIMVSVSNPFYNKKLIDRMLIASDAGEMDVFLIVNKIDEIDNIDEIIDDLSIYKDLGIDIFFISCMENEGIDKLRNFIDNKTVILTGQSGVGKSSLINALVGDTVQQVNIVSERTQKGQHTTSFVKMFELENNTKIIDTPGIREFGLYGIEKTELCYFFKDFEEYFQNCRFLPCTHTHEPDCEVINAVEQGKILYDRYESYINILESLEEI